MLLRGVFDPWVFLDLVKNFTLFQTDGIKSYKILAGYHQYHAVNKAILRTTQTL